MTSFPLSPLQESLLARRAAQPDGAQTVSLTLELQGPLDPERLRAALTAATERYEILRTRVVTSGEAARMEVGAAEPVRLALHDWSTRPPQAVETETRSLEARLRAEAWGLERPPLSAALVRLGAECHRLVLAQSALLLDGHSLWRLAQELVDALDGQQPPDDPVQFADLAHWLCETLEGEDAPAGFAYWNRVPLEAAEALRPALEHDRGATSFEPIEVRRELAPSVDEGVLQLARGRGLSSESLLAAAWMAWLARLAESERPVIGVPSAGRAFQGLDDALGAFERALPVEAPLDERLGFLQLARRIDEQLAHGAEWHEFFHPERLGAARAFGFRYGFEHLPLQADHTRGALRARVLRRGGQAEAFRALLRVEEGLQGTELVLRLDPRHYGEGDADGFLEPYLALLASALARPEAPVASLSAVSPAAHERLLERARGPALPADPRRDGTGIHAWILEVARATPEAVAVRAAGVALTYAELDRRSGALASVLADRGVRTGSFVGVHLERSVELVVALLAVLRAGGAYVPLPPSYPRERLRAMLEDSHAAVVIGSQRSREALASVSAAVIPVDGAPLEEPRTEPEVPVASTDLAYLIYTSGSSGTPKGVPVSHANLVHSTRARLAAYPGRVGRYLLLSSFAFDSSVAGIFWTLVSGGTLVLPAEGFEKELIGLPEEIERERPTHLLALPSLWALVLEHSRDAQLASLETVIVAGEACTSELVRRHHARLPRTRLYNEYGPTEGTVWSTVFDTAEPFARAQVPIGRPIPGARNYVLTPERELAPLGIAGELWIAGPGVTAGYLERPELTAERFAPDPFADGRMYRTGDRARLLPDGNLEFLGRLDHQVKVRGYRIELGEIESVLSAHPAVREATVLAREEEGGARRLVAYVTAIGPRPAETDLLRYLAERLPEYMVPGRALCLDDWPRLPNGKIDLRALPAPEEPGGFAEPQGALEIVLAALWADVLSLEQVGRDDDFFALGGHSLSATRLYARLRETLQVALPLRALFQHRTPASLAEELRRDPAQRGRVEALAEMVLAVLESEDEEQVLGA